jgi:hypothetical protein
MSISSVTQSLSALSTACLSSPVVALRAFSGVAAIEMAVRTIVDLGRIVANKKDAVEDFGKDFAGAVLYGITATNFLPGAGVIASLVFVIHSTYKAYDREAKKLPNNDYYLSTLVGVPVKFILDWTVVLCVGKLGKALEKICTAACRILTRCPDVFCNATWAAVGAVLTLGCAYHLFAGGLGATKAFFTVFGSAAAAA